jgi:hypothetical protein
MKHKYKWLDRRAAKPGPYLTLCLSEAELRHASRKLTDEKLPYPMSGAMCSTFVNRKTNELCAIVSLSESAQKNRNAIEMAGLLVHEAVHVWQAYAEHMGEERPGEEQEAYAIQSISQSLMAEYARRING